MKYVKQPRIIEIIRTFLLFMEAFFGAIFEFKTSCFNLDVENNGFYNFFTYFLKKCFLINT